MWAHNKERLEALAAYLGARLRERHASPTRVMFARLPVCKKSAEHRDEVLAGLATQGKPAQLTTPTDRCDAATARAGSNGVDGLPLISVVWPGASSVSGSRFASG
ncbi:hypothetical protein [Streptomyces sp. NBC_00073]|uniref:hypothetical protein n=1 Tax=Streptomyces sp. NBC_00073 TaxID=2975640 RepID=UPI002F919022